MGSKHSGPKLDTLRLILDTHRRIRDGASSLEDVARSLGLRADVLRRHVRAFRSATGIDPFQTMPGRGTTTEHSDLFDNIEQLLSIYDQISNGRIRRKIRLGAGMSVCTSILPEVLSEFHSRQADIEVETVYGKPSALYERERNGDLDLAIVGCDPARQEGQDGVVKRIDLKLAIICNVVDSLDPESFRWNDLQDRTVYLLAQYRSPLPSYPSELDSVRGLTIQRVGSFLVANAMAAAGRAITVAPPALLSRGIRQRVRVIDYPNAKSYSLCLIRSQRRSQQRSVKLDRALDRLQELLQARLDRLAREQGTQSIAKVGFHVTRRPDAVYWQRSTCRWDFYAPNRFTGEYRMIGSGEQKHDSRYRYQVSGQIERIPGNSSAGNIGWIGVQAGRQHNPGIDLPGEQFSASHSIDSDEQLRCGTLIGVWSGRCNQSMLQRQFTPYTGYLILESVDDASTKSSSALNSLAHSFAQQHGLAQLELPGCNTPIL